MFAKKGSNFFPYSSTFGIFRELMKREGWMVPCSQGEGARFSGKDCFGIDQIFMGYPGRG